MGCVYRGNMGIMFLESSFNGDISEWDVSNVSNMHRMFNLSAFNGDISNWDVTNVIDMHFMFAEANNFSNDISNWNVSNVNDFSEMFDGRIFLLKQCALLIHPFQQIKIGISLEFFM